MTETRATYEVFDLKQFTPGIFETESGDYKSLAHTTNTDR